MMGPKFPERLKALRLSRGLSQQQLADRLGVKKQSVCNWENDNIMPSVDRLEKIADTFHVSTDYLLGREEKPKDGVRLLDITGLSPTQEALLEAMVGELLSGRRQDTKE